MRKAIIQIEVREDGLFDVRSSEDLTQDEVTGYLVGAAVEMAIATSDNGFEATMYLWKIVHEGIKRINAKKS